MFSVQRYVSRCIAGQLLIYLMIQDETTQYQYRYFGFYIPALNKEHQYQSYVSENDPVYYDGKEVGMIKNLIFFCKSWSAAKKLNHKV